MAEEKRIPTAAYCRVSTKRDTQDGSYEVQRAYYEKLISEDPTLELVGIYGDHGKSGRYMRGRAELNRLIKDCEAGKVKLILTKSISRFARNMMECVETIRHLRELGVTIRFEKENIDTDTMGGELIIAPTYGYRKNDAGDNYEIEPEEAEVVRRIFDMYEKGITVPKIVDALLKDELHSLNTMYLAW